MDYLKRAFELKDVIVADRRTVHQFAEIGMDTVQSADYIMAELTKLGYEPKRCGGNGVVATIGNGGKTLLLRADMDALPFPEDSGEEFAATNGHSHSCGHDMHAAWLLGAARMLKENEAALEGTVKFMWQPGEETFQGSKAMLADGVLEGVDAAMACHAAAGQIPLGLVMYNDKNTMMYSNDSFKITCVGYPSHGAYPEYGIDPINIAVHVYQGLQNLIAREKSSTIPMVLTVGKINAGVANNSLPGECVMEGTMRGTDKELREKLKARLVTTAEKIAEAFGGKAIVEWTAEVPPAICNPEMVKSVIGYLGEVGVQGFYPVPDMQASASEDFACVLEQVPGVLLYISTGYVDRPVAAAHDPKVIYNEDALCQAAAYIAHAATRWLADNK